MTTGGKRSMPITRRQALKSAASAGAGLLLGAEIASPQDAIQVAGRQVEVALTPISEYTARIAIRALENSSPQPIASDGALVKEHWGPEVARVTSLSGPRAVTCGGLSVTLSSNPLTIRVAAGANRFVQECKLDP